MTEAEWRGTTNVAGMLAFLQGKASDRKFRLFAVACSRGALGRWADEPGQLWDGTLEVAERYADGAATEPEREGTAEVTFIESADDPGSTPHVFHALGPDAYFAATMASEYAGQIEGGSDLQPAMLRDIFGDPFGPVPADPRWLTSAAVTLARSMYDSRDFAPMPVLADALEEAGCDNPDVLAHCRGPGPHVRGCWVVDLILGKN